MQKKKQNRYLLKSLFFIMIGLGFVLFWQHQLKLNTNKDTGKGSEAGNEKGPVYSLEPMMIELSGRYLKIIPGGEGKKPGLGSQKKNLLIALDLVLSDKKALVLIQEHVEPIRKTVSELVSIRVLKDIETLEGKKILSDEIRDEMDGIMPKGTVNQVLFRDFIIQ